MARFIGSSGSRGSASPVVAQPARPAAAAAARTARSFRSMPALLAGVLCRLLAFSRLVEQELADQVLEHHRRLREPQPVAALQHHAVAARLQPDVLLAEDAGGE